MNRLSVVKYNPCAHRAALLQEDTSDVSTKSSLSSRHSHLLNTIGSIGRFELAEGEQQFLASSAVGACVGHILHSFCLLFFHSLGLSAPALGSLASTARRSPSRLSPAFPAYLWPFCVLVPLFLPVCPCTGQTAMIFGSFSIGVPYLLGLPASALGILSSTARGPPARFSQASPVCL